MKRTSQNKKKIPKAIILRELLNPELLENGYCEKARLQKDLEGLITRSRLEFHLYSKQENEEGLISKGIVKSDRGKLSLNLTSGRAVARMVEYLGNDTKIGSQVKYFFERAFIEAFFSYYGSRLEISGKLNHFLWDDCEDISLFFRNGEDYRHEIIKRIFPELRRIPRKGEYMIPSSNGKGYSIIMDGQFTERTGKPISEVQEKYRRVEEEVNSIDLHSKLMDFARIIYPGINVDFMLGYVLKVIQFSKISEHIEKALDTDQLALVPLYLFTTSYYFYSEIRGFLELAKPCTLSIFVEKVLRPALREDADIDKSYAKEYHLLELYRGTIEKKLKEAYDKANGILYESRTVNSVLLADDMSAVGKEFEKINKDFGPFRIY